MGGFALYLSALHSWGIGRVLNKGALLSWLKEQMGGWMREWVGGVLVKFVS